jgi:hypothetical protein
MKLKNPFKQQKSLAELQEEDEIKSTELSIARKEALIAELKARGNKWQNFSEDGTRKKISWGRMKAWIKAH